MFRGNIYNKSLAPGLSAHWLAAAFIRECRCPREEGAEIADVFNKELDAFIAHLVV